MARHNAFSAISYSTLVLVFLLIISNAECSSTDPAQPSAAATTPVISCSQVYGAQFGDTCTSIVQGFGLNAESFSDVNPNMNCNTIFVGQWICLKGVFGA